MRLHENFVPPRRMLADTAEAWVEADGRVGLCIGRFGLGKSIHIERVNRQRFKRLYFPAWH